ncbi:MAG TPA: type II toxin-antitoxin system HicA family toxin [Candidatus Binataceae bacterium]|nr:type II toxin-antitoxin system HicA family toxin [Candidatus Binataceae bacterium]
MPKLPAIGPKDLVKALERAGFVRWRQKGSHLSMYRESDRRALTIPMHFAKTVPKGTLHAILKQAGLSVEDLERLR